VTSGKSRAGSSGKPRTSTEPLYLLLREGRVEDFNRRRAAGEQVDLTGCNLRGLDLRTCRLDGASLHAAHVSGVYFPAHFAPAEIELSVRLGTRLRPTPEHGR
jgi:uncharacterized protein YjbI with pentapeptide repeats